MKEIQNAADGKLKVASCFRDAYMAVLGELFLLNLIKFEQFSALNDALAALECE